MFTKQYTVKDEHIDCQGIMDGLFYPFYMEDCRHEYVNNIIGFDIIGNAQNGINIVLSEYTIKFIRSLKKGDLFEVTCGIDHNLTNSNRLAIKQEILLSGKKCTEGIFLATCVKASGGRPFLTEGLLKAIQADTAPEQ